MRKFALLLLFVPAALPAQSIQTIAPQQCVWHTGDNPAWAAPNLDDSAWQPWQDWKPQFAHPRLWVRCHIDPAPLRDDSQPAIQVALYSAYQLYLNGVRIGEEGNLHNGNSSLDAIQSYPVPSSLLAPGPATIALRITNRLTLSNSGPFRAIVDAPLEIRAGDATLLDALRARTALARAAQFAPTAIGFGIIGVLAVVLLGLYFYDRSRSELLLLSIACFSLAALRINELAGASMLNYSVSAGLVILGLGNIGLTVTEVPFFYALARRRMPWPILALLGIMAAAYIPTWMDAFAAGNQPAWMGAFNALLVRPFALLSHIVLSFVPFIVFGAWRDIPRRIRPLAVCVCFGARQTSSGLWWNLPVCPSPACQISSPAGASHSWRRVPSPQFACSPHCSPCCSEISAWSWKNAPSSPAKCTPLSKSSPCSRPPTSTPSPDCASRSPSAPSVKSAAISMPAGSFPRTASASSSATSVAKAPPQP